MLDWPQGESAKTMSKRDRRSVRGDVMRGQYDFSRGVRGKYVSRCSAGSNVVVLSPDVARGFPTSQSVDNALRAQMIWKTLSSKERQILVLHYFEQSSFREIGQVLGLPVARVEQVHARVLKRLRGRMKPLVSELLSPKA